MADRNKDRGFAGQIILVSAPWPLFNRPSIQLGVLKGYLQAIDPSLKVSCHHFFLRLAEAIGYPLYRLLSSEVWLAESVYAALLYPDRQDRLHRFFNRQARRRSKKFKELVNLDFFGLIKQVKNVSDSFIEETDWTALDLAGFSVCLCQLTASLYFIRRIRQRAPALPLVAGGSIIGGRAADDLLATFPEIDLIITGEGELPLVRLINHLKAGGRCSDLPPTDGLVRREDSRAQAAVPFCQLSSLETLPRPDFTDYFELLETFASEKRFFPTLPLEISRGCWWRSAGSFVLTQERSRGCAFCNLNLQWQGYRTKNASQIVDEIDQLTDKHRVLSLAFMDNALPPKKSRDIFHELAGYRKNFYCFAELRASTGRQTLENLCEAGMKEVQIGIESLSSRLLKKLNKGTTAIENLEIMKHCEALGLKNIANLILRFPGSDETDVVETLRTIRFARFFRPLRIVHFWLGMQSPVWQNPRDYGLLAVYNHPYYKDLFPEDVCRRMRFMIQDYRGDKMMQRKIWRPVAEAVKKWQKDYEQLHSKPYAGPVLTWHDGQQFLILRERRIREDSVNHRLEGTSREIYLFCEHRRGFEEIREKFSSFSADKIKSFLSMMTTKGLMFEDGGHYLSLAIPADQCRYSGHQLPQS
ncbi:MAG: RiPP maturation radical SAM C-methyltransferase [Desulfobia sp.]